MVTNPTREPSSNSLSLSLPSPKAPPEYPDLYGKRREMARIQMLEREISFLEEELKSSEGFQPASKCCIEIADFVMANSDPLLPTSKKNRRSCRLWKWLCRMRCLNLSWNCCWCCDCFSACCHCKPSHCKCSTCLPSINCSLKNWCCCHDKKSLCCKECCGCKTCCCILPGCKSYDCKCSCICPCFLKVLPGGCCTKC
ncbi:guanine nucleotide-binding protein subunit gamma 3-like [Trifolium pratense]|uniref:guanine nucleotide-binding protein subunit gamma 3-like n=1 Tax=Trifolium pratense TaxID=57577 RepID=UPI001E697FA8|nr:guanine nucleotide-binding protein subunit gamma 3-like [Trifolium pratense]